MNKNKCPKRVKNPCIICLQSVKKKNGVQCRGACCKWAHYTCLNFTPGKIKDIKAGIISVVCPCPKCDTQGAPKEFLTEPHVLCDQPVCPANKASQCDKPGCPLNIENLPIPQKGPLQQNLPCNADFCKTKVPQTMHQQTSYNVLPMPPQGPQPILPHQRAPLYPQGQQPVAPCGTHLYTQTSPDASILSHQQLTSQPPSAEAGLTYMRPSPKMNTSNPAPIFNNSGSSLKPQTQMSKSCSCFTSNEVSSRFFMRNPKTDEDTFMKGRLPNSDSRLICMKQEEQRKVLSVIRQLCDNVGNLSNEIKNLMTRALNEPGDTSLKL